MFLFAFRSRTQSMKLYDLLRSGGIACEIVNTPRDIAASCGLSVRVPDEAGERAFDVFEYYKPDTLIGVFYGDGRGYRRYR
ncbi:MAG: DUF3343 domain-containing protein [Clostridia bacterium]|nr:DUF3343 domain-containing protein [Clostridia bacterium]